MSRRWNIALAVVAVAEISAAVYVVHSNHAPRSHAAAPPVRPSTSTSAGSTGASLGIDATSATERPVIAFLGDDWTAGTAASSRTARFSTLLCSQLQAVERNFGVEGTGYAKPSASGGPYKSRIPAIVAADPQVVVVSGGRNDQSDSPATAAEAARTLFASLHAELPDATLIAIAPFWGDSDSPPEMIALGHAVERAVTAAGGSYLDVEDQIHHHSSFMANAADPNDQGYAAIAAALAPELEPLLPS